MKEALLKLADALLSKEQMKRIKGGYGQGPSCPDGGEANYCITTFDSSTESNPYATTQSGGWVCGCGGSTYDAQQWVWDSLGQQGVADIALYVNCYY